jgi:hypothetical protein
MKKSNNDANRDRFGDELKKKRLKGAKAKRHSVRQQLHDVSNSNISDMLDSLDDFNEDLYDDNQ